MLTHVDLVSTQGVRQCKSPLKFLAMFVSPYGLAVKCTPIPLGQSNRVAQSNQSSMHDPFLTPILMLCLITANLTNVLGDLMMVVALLVINYIANR